MNERNLNVLNLDVGAETMNLANHKAKNAANIVN